MSLKKILVISDNVRSDVNIALFPILNLLNEKW